MFQTLHGCSDEVETACLVLPLLFVLCGHLYGGLVELVVLWECFCDSLAALVTKSLLVGASVTILICWSITSASFLARFLTILLSSSLFTSFLSFLLYFFLFGLGCLFGLPLLFWLECDASSFLLSFSSCLYHSGVNQVLVEQFLRWLPVLALASVSLLSLSASSNMYLISAVGRGSWICFLLFYQQNLASLVHLVT